MGVPQANQKSKALKENKKGPFLIAFAHYGQVSGAAEAVGISRDTVYEWIKNDPSFAKSFSESKEVTADKLEGVLFRKAFSDGDVNATKMLLQSLRPEKFTDRHKVEFEAQQIPHIVSAFVNIIRRHVAAEHLPHVIADLQHLVKTPIANFAAAPLS
jgi:hypothetical protein